MYLARAYYRACALVLELDTNSFWLLKSLHFIAFHPDAQANIIFPAPLQTLNHLRHLLRPILRHRRRPPGRPVAPVARPAQQGAEDGGSQHCELSRARPTSCSRWGQRHRVGQRQEARSDKGVHGDWCQNLMDHSWLFFSEDLSNVRSSRSIKLSMHCIGRLSSVPMRQRFSLFFVESLNDSSLSCSCSMFDSSYWLSPHLHLLNSAMIIRNKLRCTLKQAA